MTRPVANEDALAVLKEMAVANRREIVNAGLGGGGATGWGAAGDLEGGPPRLRAGAPCRAAARHPCSRTAPHLRRATAKVWLQSRNASWRSMFFTAFAGRTRRRGCCSCCKWCA